METIYRPLDNKNIRLKAKNNIRGKLWLFWSLNIVIGVIAYLIGIIPELFFDTSEITNLLTGSTTTIPREVNWSPLIWTEVVALILEIITIPLYFGYYRNVNNWTRGKYERRFKVLFSCYKSGKKFFKSIAIGVLSIILCSLALCLFIVPGVMLSLAYTLAPYIFFDEPELSAVQILKKSREMMKGYKGQLFTLYLSFLGWLILGAFTFGILYIWICPYFSSSIAIFYDEVRHAYYGDNDPIDASKSATILGNIFDIK